VLAYHKAENDPIETSDCLISGVSPGYTPAILSFANNVGGPGDYDCSPVPLIDCSLICKQCGPDARMVAVIGSPAVDCEKNTPSANSFPTSVPGVEIGYFPRACVQEHHDEPIFQATHPLFCRLFGCSRSTKI
jgi:hypothetical protein